MCAPSLSLRRRPARTDAPAPQIDTIDPAFAPATGTPETGGWSTRELREIVRGLDGLHLVGADLVEVAPAYDTNAELTTMAAADVSPSPSSSLCRAVADVLVPGVVRGAERDDKDAAGDARVRGVACECQCVDVGCVRSTLCEWNRGE